MAGDVDAFESLVAYYQQPVWRYLRHFLGDADLADDVAQETFVRVFRKLHTYRFRARFSTWIIQVARNVALDTIRSQDRRSRLIDALPPPRPAPPPGLGAELDAALATLTPARREALLAVEVLGLPYREAAAVLGIPEGTVKSRVHQARRQLVTWMEADDTGRGDPAAHPQDGDTGTGGAVGRGL